MILCYLSTVRIVSSKADCYNIMCFIYFYTFQNDVRRKLKTLSKEEQYQLRINERYSLTGCHNINSVSVRGCGLILNEDINPYDTHAEKSKRTARRSTTFILST